MKLRTILILLGALVAALPAVADDVVYAGGRILASDGKTPLPDCTIAVYGENGKVIANGKTDASGHYSLPVPRDALHLRKKGGSFLGGILNGAGKLLNVAASTVPLALTSVAAVSGVIGVANTASSAKTVPVPTSAEGQDKLKKMVDRMQPGGAQTNLSDSSMKELMANYPDASAQTAASDTPTATSPGALVFRVICPGHTEVAGVGQLYWMQDEPSTEKGKKTKTVAWSDPIWLAKEGDKEPSKIVRGYFAFADAKVEPAIVEFGRTVAITVKLPLPEEPKVDITVVAHNSKTGEIWELSPLAGNVYKMEVLVDDKKFDKNDQTISILAYARGNAPGRNKKIEDEINGVGMWKADKKFEYNPRIVASRNRVDLRLTVVEPPKEKKP